MKTSLCSCTLAVLIPFFSSAQNLVNWRSLDQKQFIQVNTGLENGYVIGIGYGYKLPIRRNLLLSADYSFPTGNRLVDDFKIRLGAQSEVVRWRHWSVTVRAYSIFRRYENAFASISNFGSEFSMVAGYAKPRWQVMGEFGFDKAITSHIKNTDVMKNIYPNAKDGWYVPTGGNFFFGLLSSYSFGRQDLFLRAGKMANQDLETPLFLPFYLRIGFNHRF